MRYITSAENKVYKQTKKLLMRSYRKQSKLFLAEGERIVCDALASGAASYIVVSESYKGEKPDVLTYCFPDKLFSGISSTENTQGIIAVCSTVEKTLQDISGGTLLICDGISDPGNLGTMIRTAECAGAGGVIVLKGSADIYNPKTVRATMGSIFRVPLHIMEAQHLSMLDGYTIAAAMLDNSQTLYNTAFPHKTAVIIGSEAHGVSALAAQYADIRIKIPMCGGAQSLNAAIAASVILYEVYRQKDGGGGGV